MQPDTSARPKLQYAVIVCVMMIAIMAGQLATRAALSAGAFELEDLKAEYRGLSLQVQSLDESLLVLNSPQNVSRQAQRYGLEIGQGPAFLRLSNGHISGNAGPGGEATELPMGDEAVPNDMLPEYEPIDPDQVDGVFPAPVTH